MLPAAVSPDPRLEVLLPPWRSLGESPACSGHRADSVIVSPQVSTSCAPDPLCGDKCSLYKQQPPPPPDVLCPCGRRGAFQTEWTLPSLRCPRLQPSPGGGDPDQRGPGPPPSRHPAQRGSGGLQTAQCPRVRCASRVCPRGRRVFRRTDDPVPTSFPDLGVWAFPSVSDTRAVRRC